MAFGNANKTHCLSQQKIKIAGRAANERSIDGPKICKPLKKI